MFYSASYIVEHLEVSASAQKTNFNYDKISFKLLAQCNLTKKILHRHRLDNTVEIFRTALSDWFSLFVSNNT